MASNFDFNVTSGEEILEESAEITESESEEDLFSSSSDFSESESSHINSVNEPPPNDHMPCQLLDTNENGDFRL